MKRMTKWCVMVLVVVGATAGASTGTHAQVVDSLVAVDALTPFPKVPSQWKVTVDSSAWKVTESSRALLSTARVDSTVWTAADSLIWQASVDFSDWPASLSGTEQAVPQNVRITIQLIQANGFRDPDPAIAAIVDELQQLFRFEGYRLLSEATMISEVPTEDQSSYLSQRIAGRTPESSFEEVFGISLQLEPTGTPGIVRVRGQLVDAITAEEILSVGFSARTNQTIVIGSSKYDPNKPTLIVAFRMEQAGN